MEQEKSMGIIYRMAWVAPAVLLTMAVVAHADGFNPQHGGKTTRTYFGTPGVGPYGHPGMGGGYNPYTCKIFGLRCCKTAQTVEDDYQRRMAAAQARAAVIVNRVQPKHLCGNLASGCADCNCPPQGCNDCWLFGKCNGGGCAGGGCGPGGCGHGGYGQGGAGMLPGMNREDAVRYLEGFQYYPPYQIVRSPRDFFMFDTKYGTGH
jgi:hypothetical protein